MGSEQYDRLESALEVLSLDAHARNGISSRSAAIRSWVVHHRASTAGAIRQGFSRRIPALEMRALERSCSSTATDGRVAPLGVDRD